MSYVERSVEEVVTTGLYNSSKGNKRFWSYIKHCRQDTTGVASLLGEDFILIRLKRRKLSTSGSLTFLANSY